MVTNVVASRPPECRLLVLKVDFKITKLDFCLIQPVPTRINQDYFKTSLEILFYSFWLLCFTIYHIFRYLLTQRKSCYFHYCILCLADMLGASQQHHPPKINRCKHTNCLIGPVPTRINQDYFKTSLEILFLQTTSLSERGITIYPFFAQCVEQCA